MAAQTTIKTPSAGAATPFLEALTVRRSIYALDKSIPIADARVEEILKHAILHVPSSFNSQSTRIVYLSGSAHDQLWDITLAALKAIVPAEAFEPTAAKIAGFKGAHGSVLFFDDQAAVEALASAFPTYAANFPPWARESSAMHEYAVWTALALEGVGANLQHYNELIADEVAKTWNLPATWTLRAQMVIGGVIAGAGEKTFKTVEGERYLSFN
jgi:predicted oxidoreductase (fatty acid repression mutant protein)